MSAEFSHEHNQVMLTGVSQDEKLAAEFTLRVEEDLDLWVIEYPNPSVAHMRLSELTTLAVVRGMNEPMEYQEKEAFVNLEAKIESLRIPHILLFNVDKAIEELSELELKKPGQIAD